MSETEANAPRIGRKTWLTVALATIAAMAALAVWYHGSVKSYERRIEDLERTTDIQRRTLEEQKRMIKSLMEENGVSDRVEAPDEVPDDATDAVETPVEAVSDVPDFDMPEIIDADADGATPPDIPAEPDPEDGDGGTESLPIE